MSTIKVKKTRTARKTGKSGASKLEEVMEDVCKIMKRKKDSIDKKMKTSREDVQKSVEFFTKNEAKLKKDIKFLTSKKALEHRKKLVFLCSKEVEFSFEDFAPLKKTMKEKDDLGFMKLAVALFVKYDVAHQTYPLAIEWGLETRKKLRQYNVTFLEHIIKRALDKENIVTEKKVSAVLDNLDGNSRWSDEDELKKIWTTYVDQRIILEGEARVWKDTIKLETKRSNKEESSYDDSKDQAYLKKTNEKAEELLHKEMDMFLDLGRERGKNCLQFLKDEDTLPEIIVRILFHNAVRDLKSGMNFFGKFGSLFTLYLDASDEGKEARKKTKGPGMEKLVFVKVDLSKEGKADITELYKTCKALDLL
mmetsp:Transcript_21445/g.35503  ORF Transcript_21445/g.35503 Transcript_21445/m.35503 type:complete len:364 (-) Transcript_21445:226-1317(-)|eukprot:CAMPEP_0119012958 /NCGR_PEP_ID=MMETSP1176-20130426/7718_1 /TAXON_ID=265551 /ORGANISM="Synedropsis recta cf, Strain CCMP1620" /LENGTH=363 /DNA_ID=CAMNT_0006965999 /DNA_START=85 /DNA_END=1176 /DNA_ORIENTATION=-